MQINWEAAGAIGEIAGALAVIVTLVYLARQLHQNNLLMKEQASYNMLQNQLSYYDGMAREPELVNVVYGIPLDDVQATMAKKAEAHATAEFFRWQWEYMRMAESVFCVEDLPLEGFRREWRHAQFGPHWEAQKHIFHPDFVAMIDSEVAAKADT